MKWAIPSALDLELSCPEIRRSECFRRNHETDLLSTFLLKPFKKINVTSFDCCSSHLGFFCKDIMSQDILGIGANMTYGVDPPPTAVLPLTSRLYFIGVSKRK